MVRLCQVDLVIIVLSLVVIMLRFVGDRVVERWGHG